MAEWPTGAAEPAEYCLSNLPVEMTMKNLVPLAKHRWIVERYYLESKRELGLGHCERRSWRAFHHQATLSIAAYRFLVAERSRFSLGPCRKVAARGERSRPRAIGSGAAPRQKRRCEPASIATLRSQIAACLIRQLPCCPFCGGRRLSPSSTNEHSGPVPLPWRNRLPKPMRPGEPYISA